MAKREQSSAAELNLAAKGILTQIQGLFQQIPKLGFIGSFASMEDKKEIPMGGINHYLAQNHALALPKIEGNRMHFYSWHLDDPLPLSPWGIPEPLGQTKALAPDSIQAFLIPLLIADVAGNRLGYGKGFYDAYLTQAHPNALKIGLCQFPPITQVPELRLADIPLDYLIEPQQTWKF